MSATGFFLGVLGLAGLEVVLSSERASNRVPDLVIGLEAITNRIVSPTVGLIPNLHDTGATSSTDTTTSTQAAPPLTSIPTRAVPPRRSSGRSNDPTTGRAPVIALPTGTPANSNPDLGTLLTGGGH